MKTYTMRFQNENLFEIVIKPISYDKGTIWLVVSNNKCAQELYEKLLKTISKEHLDVLNNVLILKDTFFLRKLIGILEQDELLSEAERSEIYSVLHEIEEIDGQRSKLEWNINKSQTEAMEYVSSVYIDDIIEQSKDCNTVITLLRSAFSPRLHQFWQPLQLFIKENGMDNSLIDSIQSLWKVLHGCANMESTYLRLEKNQLPDLYLQRVMIYEQCITAFKKKFNDLDNKSKFCMIFGLLMFVHLGQQISPLSEITITVESILKMKPVSVLAKEILNVNIAEPDIECFLDKVFSEMDMPKDYEDRMQVIKALQIEFDSPELLRYLHSKEQVERMIEDDKNNLLLQGLEEENAEKIKKAMQDGTDINQDFFCDGRTPLLVAVQSCNLEILKLILSYKPTLDQWNRFNTITALGIALTNKNPSKVEMLLQAGVCVFQPCGIVAQEKRVSQDEPPKMPREKHKKYIFAKPLTICLRLYQEDKSIEVQQNIRLLLKYGAGIFHQFSVRCDELLENAVIPLSSYHMEGIKVNAIFDYETLLKRISVDDLPHWRDVFVRAKAYFQSKYDQAADTSELQFLGGFLLPFLNEFFKKIVTKLVCKNVPNFFGSMRNHVSNERFFSLVSNLSDAIPPNLHDKVMRELLLIAPQKRQVFQPFFIAMAEKNYGKALRRACTTTDPDAFLLIKKLLKYKNHLKIDVNEQAGKSNRAALHYSALKGNRQVYKFLIEHKANPDLLDANKKSPGFYMEMVDRREAEQFRQMGNGHFFRNQFNNSL